MIDWFDLAANSLWIIGCAVALASLSYAIWMASMRQKKVAHHSFWIRLPDRSEPIWLFVLSWTGCYVRRPLGNLDVAAAGSLVRCPNVNNNPQE